MAFTVIWYGRQSIIDKVIFDAEKVAKRNRYVSDPKG